MEEVGTCQRCQHPFWLNKENDTHCPDCRAVIRKLDKKDNEIKTRQEKYGFYGQNAKAIVSDMNRKVYKFG